jgi:transcriptional regulator GlxA family with amidase domain
MKKEEAMMVQPADSNERPEFLERHYTLAELGDAWHMSNRTLRKWFLREPGVIRFGKSTYTSMRIPESVARKVYLEKINRSPRK